jgi:hypothetical protein
LIRLRPHPHLYEINTWAWLEELSERNHRLIKLADVPGTEWDALASRGFDIIWLMGVWQRSPESKLIALSDPQNPPLYDRALPGWKPTDVVGSPYAVMQYAPDPRMGTWDDLDLVRRQLRARGMSLFLDFVGNHTALDHPWTREHPEFYVQGSQKDFERDPSMFYRMQSANGTVFIALGKDPYFPPWRDVAQLNHFQPGMRAAQLADLRTIAGHCDGVRCDMAMLHLSDIFARIWAPFLNGLKAPSKEFWTEAHAAVPDLILLAEAYWGTESRLLDLGFSFTYDKDLYDAVRDENPSGVRARLAGDAEYQNHFARFLENHDEGRCAAIFGPERRQEAATLMGTVPGMRFYHQGELEGRRIHLPITLRVAAEEPPDPAASACFNKILQITKDDVFHEGKWSLLAVTQDNEPTSENLIAYEWRSDKAWKVIVANVTGETALGRVQFGDRMQADKSYIFFDELNQEPYPRSGKELRESGLFVRRDRFGAHLFDVTFT